MNNFILSYLFLGGFELGLRSFWVGNGLFDKFQGFVNKLVLSYDLVYSELFRIFRIGD